MDNKFKEVDGKLKDEEIEEVENLKFTKEDLKQKKVNPFRAEILKYFTIIFGFVGGYVALANTGVVQGQEIGFLVTMISGGLSVKLATILKHYYHYLQFKKENNGKDLTMEEYAEKYENYYKTKYRTFYEWDKKNGKGR